jgi:hypothetical protein
VAGTVGDRGRVVAADSGAGRVWGVGWGWAEEVDDALVMGWDEGGGLVYVLTYLSYWLEVTCAPGILSDSRCLT